MFKNNLSIALRHITGHKLFSLINIFCLAIGITFSFLIGEYIIDQKSVNTTLRNYKNQYVIKSKWNPTMGLDITTLGPLAKTVNETYPNLVKNYCRFNLVGNVVSYQDKNFNQNIFIGDTTLVSMFGFPLLYGDKDHVFRNGESVVITESIAMKFFGRKDVLDKVLSIQSSVLGNKHDFIITAVLKDLPNNSVTNFITGVNDQVFLPMESNFYYQEDDRGDNWKNNAIVSIIELQPGVKPETVIGALKNIIAIHAPDNFKGKLTPELVGLKDYYLNANNGAIQKMIRTLSFITVFILLMAIINFVNINIGTSSYRIKEIGLRKVFGSSRTQLIVLYITESVLLTFITGLISLAFYEILRPVFTDLLNTSMAHFWQFGLTEIVLLLLLLITVGIAAGIYPAFVLSALKVVTSVQGKLSGTKSGQVLRKALLVIQFSLAISIFISTLFISKQLSYFLSKDPGYKKEQLMLISSIPRGWDSVGVTKMLSVRDQLTQIAGVENATLSFDIPNQNFFNGAKLVPEGRTENEAINVTKISADENYAGSYKLQMKEGYFLDQGTHVKGKVVINETAAKLLGLTSPIGKPLTVAAQSIKFKPVVAGVVKDFNYKSMQNAIEPLIIVNIKDDPAYRSLSLRLNTNDLTRTVADIGKKWRQLYPDLPFEFSFMEDKFKSVYYTEMQLKNAAVISTILNLIIVFLGIFGVVAFTLTKRTKEIAMRKVLGAGTPNIIFLFIKDYAAPILLANIIAWPVAYWIISTWLENYAYKINIGFIPFLLVGALSFVSAFLLIALQCLKVASASPIKGIRAE